MMCLQGILAMPRSRDSLGRVSILYTPLAMYRLGVLLWLRRYRGPQPRGSVSSKILEHPHNSVGRRTEADSP